jgi:hypothetical protein
MRAGLLISVLVLALPVALRAQTIKNFSGDQETFRQELVTFMGPNLSPDQEITFNRFLNVWDSLDFSRDIRSGIINVSSQLAGRNMRPSPGFMLFFKTILTFTSSEKGLSYFGEWLKGLSETVFNPRYPTASIEKFLEVSALMISENTLFKSNSVKWKVAEGTFTFSHDTVFKLKLTDATLICYAQNDSTVVTKVNGTYFPDLFQFQG